MSLYSRWSVSKNTRTFSFCKFLCFSSFSEVAKFSPKDTCGGSIVYQKTLGFQRPRIIRWNDTLQNSVTFIGSIIFPVKKIVSKTGSFGVHTTLEVQNPKSQKSFQILLMMWSKMAEIAMTYLKPKDFVYVAGHLGSYTKPVDNGSPKIKYKITVNELNYVKSFAGSQTNQQTKPYILRENTLVSDDVLPNEKTRERLHLWQVFFANPHEWWDNRGSKKSPRMPDFKHKATRECLWINEYDPPWIKKVLQMYDSGRFQTGKGPSKGEPSLMSMLDFMD